MNYEKLYKEALGRAKTIYYGSYKPDIAATIVETLQNIFPELKELEEDKEIDIGLSKNLKGQILLYIYKLKIN